MDNNPFRSQQPQTGNYMTPTMGGQAQQQPQQQPYQSNYNNNLGGGYTPSMGTPQSGYQQPPQQAQQQPWQYQNGMMSTATPPPQQSNFSSALPQQNSFTSTLPSTNNVAPPTQFSPYSSNATLMSSAATGNVNTPPQMNTFGAGGNTYQPYSMPTPNTSNYPNNNGMFNNQGYQQQQPYQQQQDSSNFYIPPNFGMSTPTSTTPNNNNMMFQQQQSRHAPVDASSLLKGTQVRRVECPVCQKMLEGDDMAVNHHVNEHYT